MVKEHSQLHTITEALLQTHLMALNITSEAERPQVSQLHIKIQALFQTHLFRQGLLPRMAVRQSNPAQIATGKSSIQSASKHPHKSALTRTHFVLEPKTETFFFLVSLRNEIINNVSFSFSFRQKYRFFCFSFPVFVSVRHPGCGRYASSLHSSCQCAIIRLDNGYLDWS